MNRERGLADAERRGRLFVEQPAGHKWKDFALTGCQPGHPPLKGRQLDTFDTSVTIPRDGGVDRVQQLRLTEWFRQKVDGARLERPDGARHVGMPGNEHDVRVIRGCDASL